MSASPVVNHGSFTGLAEDYSRFRPSYSEAVRDALLGAVGKNVASLDIVDVGAGTGIWTRMLAARKPKSVIAVEPNAEMRSIGQRDSGQTGIDWREGSGEDTGLPPECCDLLTMASSFHWVDFDKGTKEFFRVLRPGGRFAALWNPRYLEANPVLLNIEQHLHELEPGLRRVSSGRSGMTETLAQRLSDSPFFENVLYLEARFVVTRTVEDYIGAWKSTNDVQAQLGPRKFGLFLDFARLALRDYEAVEVTYLTRAWSARRRDGARL